MKTQNIRRVTAPQLGLIVAAFALALSGRAQDKVEYVFTNVVVTFTNLEGGIYENANLIRASSRDLIFKTNGDFGTVSLTNLSEAAFERLGVPQEFVQKARENDRRVAEAAARERALFAAEQQSLRNPTNLMRIILEAAPDRMEYNPRYGYVYHVRARLPDGRSTNLFVARLPARIQEWFGKVQSLEQSIGQLSNQVQGVGAQLAEREQGLKQRQLQIDRADAVTPHVMVQQVWYGYTGYYYYDPLVAQRSAINLAQVEQKNAVATLDEAKSALGGMQDEWAGQQAQLHAMKEAQSSATSLLVLFSRFLHNGNRLAVAAPEDLPVAAQ